MSDIDQKSLYDARDDSSSAKSYPKPTKNAGSTYSSKLCPKFLPWAADSAQTAHYEM
jgi:hypothetical protein